MTGMIISQTCPSCQNNIHSDEHKQQREQCSKIKQQRMAGQEKNKAPKKFVPRPFWAKRYSNGKLSKTEFY
jgi:hypothetical protein